MDLKGLPTQNSYFALYKYPLLIKLILATRPTKLGF